jgi:hypothetical protein
LSQGEAALPPGGFAFTFIFQLTSAEKLLATILIFCHGVLEQFAPLAEDLKNVSHRPGPRRHED